jgi:hypothetical protein
LALAKERRNMKIFSAVVASVLIVMAANAQEAKKAKVLAQVAAISEKVVKDSPFSADAVSESVQELADGNRIVRSATTKLYRNSEGRFRRELQGGSGGVLGSVYTTGRDVTILDPLAGRQYMLDLELKIAQAARLKPLPETGTETEAQVAVTKPPEAELLAVELKATRDAKRRAETSGELAEELAVVAGTIPRGASAGYLSHNSTKYETRSEQLGSQIIEGVEAVGTRNYTTIPAGAIGNERPIEIVYERWYSNELQMTVYSKHIDPRFGEQTYRLTNIIRSEPDPSLFELPNGYTVVRDPSSVYRLSKVKAAAEKANAEVKVKP